MTNYWGLILSWNIRCRAYFNFFWFNPTVSVFEKTYSLCVHASSNSLSPALIQPFAAAFIIAALLQRAVAVGKLRTWRTPTNFVAGTSPSQRFGVLRPALFTLATTTRRTGLPTPATNHIPGLGFPALQS